MSSFILTLNESEKWNTLFHKLPSDQQDIYYTPEYYRLYEKNGDGKAMCFVYKQDKNLALYPILHNSINKLGYHLDNEYFDIQGAYGYNGVISTTQSESFRNGFYNEFDTFCIDNNIVAEFVRFNPLLKNHQFSCDHLEVLFDRKTIALNLCQSYDYIWSNQYSSNNRNTIRKGQKTLRVEISKAETDLDKFIKMYLFTMKRVKANQYYLFPDKYFSNLISFFPNNLYIFSAFESGNADPIGAMLIMIFKEKAHYHLSARSNDCTNNSVTNILLDEAIKFSKASNCKIFHFGGGNTDEENDPLFKFKKNFSKKTHSFYIGKKIHIKSIYNSVCLEWEQKNPHKIDSSGRLLLKYHE